MLDQNTILGTGVITPLRRSGRDFVHGGGIASIHSAIRQIISTEKGELPWDPDFGVNLGRMRHKNITDTLLAEGEAEVLLAISTYEPRAEVLGVETYQDRTVRERFFIRVQWQAVAKSTSRNTVITGQEFTEVAI